MPESQSQQWHPRHYSWRCCFFPRQCSRCHWGTRAEAQSTRQASWLPPRSGPQHIQPRSSRGPSPIEGENNLDDLSHKWVINLSSTSLTWFQRSLLAKGPNYVIALRHPPNLEYITAIESLCPKLSPQVVEEPGSNVNKVLRGSHPPNLTLARKKHRQ